MGFVAYVSNILPIADREGKGSGKGAGYMLSYRLQLHGACWLLPCRPYQKGSMLHISSE